MGRLSAMSEMAWVSPCQPATGKMRVTFPYNGSGASVIPITVPASCAASGRSSRFHSCPASGSRAARGSYRDMGGPAGDRRLPANWNLADDDVGVSAAHGRVAQPPGRSSCARGRTRLSTD